MPRFLKLLAPVFVGFIIHQLPLPVGLTHKAWTLFAIFVATILGIMIKAVPMSVVALASLSVAIGTNTIDVKDSLAGYSHEVVWLIVYVFFFARGFIKSGLGSRIAYFFVKRLGKHALGLSYGLSLTELIIAPAIPSNAARAGGIIYPIVRGISESLGSRVGDGTERKLGAFLMQVSFHNNLVASAIFLTAMAANPMVQAFAAKQGIVITWLDWFIAASVPGLLSMALVPLVLYFLYPPRLKRLPQAPGMAEQKLQEMGKMSSKEWIMAGTFAAMLVLWVLGDALHIKPVVVALWGITFLLLMGILKWEDLLQEKEAWDILVWFAILINLAKHLEEFGFIAWFSQNLAYWVHGFSWLQAMVILSLVYFYAHYFFASNTSHVGAMYAAFLGVAVAAGAPPLLTALVLGFFSSLSAHMTHYGSSSAVILFGSGYVSLFSWWSMGFVISLVNIVIWLGVGGMWWQFLGLW